MSNANAIPLSYDTPAFPSLYWPFQTDPNEAKYLYTLTDIWKFTLYWTLITTPLAHLVVAAWAIFMQFLAARQRAKYLSMHTPKPRDKRRTTTNSRTRDDGSDVGSSSSEEEGGGRSNLRARTQASSSTSTTSQNPSTTSRPRERRRKLSAKNRKLLGDSPYQSFVKYAGLILAVYIVIGALEALMAGSLVGVVLGAVYNAGYFRMSVWTPLFWGIINMLVLILSSFHISGGM